jgi:hypothetical protein
MTSSLAWAVVPVVPVLTLIVATFTEEDTSSGVDVAAPEYSRTSTASSLLVQVTVSDVSVPAATFHAMYDVTKSLLVTFWV